MDDDEGSFPPVIIGISRVQETQTADDHQDDASVVAHRWIGLLAWTLCPLVGAALGWALPRIVNWLHDLSWVPLNGPLELVHGLPEPHMRIGAMIVGVIGGALLAAMVVADLVTVAVTDDKARIARGRHAHDVLRSAVGSVHLDGDDLVVLDRRSAEMVRVATGLPADDLRPAFTAHGYPWTSADPYLETYRSWVDGDPDLPPGADALLRRRAAALRDAKKDRADEVRAELARVGVVVHDRDSAQVWRRLENDT